MLINITSDVMRTTLDIDEPILRDLKARAKAESKSLGRLASELLARALKLEEENSDTISRIDAWISSPMGARVDFSDSEALYAAMDRPPVSAIRVAEEK